MAIRFETEKEGATPARKEVGGKTYVAEEPSAKPEPSGTENVLPFGKPAKPDKKPRKTAR